MQRALHLLCFLAICRGLVTPQASAQNFIGLGEAANYAVLGANVNLHNVSVTGDVGVAANGALNIGGPSELHGNAYLGAGTTFSNNGLLDGILIQPYAINQALADAISASQNAATLSPNLVFSSITNSLVIQAAGAQTVVNVTGDLDLSSGEYVHFDGIDGQKLILNIYGGFTLGGDASIRGLPGSGIDAGDILINMVGTGDTVTTGINNNVEGTMLTINRAVAAHNFTGAVLGGNLEIRLTSGATVQGIAYVPIAYVPEPSSMLLFALGGFLLISRRSRAV